MHQLMGQGDEDLGPWLIDVNFQGTVLIVTPMGFFLQGGNSDDDIVGEVQVLAKEVQRTVYQRGYGQGFVTFSLGDKGAGGNKNITANVSVGFSNIDHTHLSSYIHIIMQWKEKSQPPRYVFTSPLSHQALPGAPVLIKNSVTWMAALIQSDSVLKESTATGIRAK